VNNNWLIAIKLIKDATVVLWITLSNGLKNTVVWNLKKIILTEELAKNVKKTLPNLLSLLPTGKMFLKVMKTLWLKLFKMALSLLLSMLTVCNFTPVVFSTLFTAQNN